MGLMAGKVVIVTGGGHGGGKALASHLDVINSSSCQAVASRTFEAFGQINGLITEIG